MQYLAFCLTRREKKEDFEFIFANFFSKNEQALCKLIVMDECEACISVLEA